MPNSFDALATLQVEERTFRIFRLEPLATGDLP